MDLSNKIDSVIQFFFAEQQEFSFFAKGDCCLSSINSVVCWLSVGGWRVSVVCWQHSLVSSLLSVVYCLLSVFCSLMPVDDVIGPREFRPRYHCGNFRHVVTKQDVVLAVSGIMITWSHDHLIPWSPDHIITWSHHHLITSSPDHIITWSHHHMITWVL